MHVNLPGLAHWAGRLRAWSLTLRLLRVSACLLRACRYNVCEPFGFQQAFWQLQVINVDKFVGVQVVRPPTMCLMHAINVAFLMAVPVVCNVSPGCACWTKPASV